jgi:hypothetical protein
MTPDFGAASPSPIAMGLGEERGWGEGRGRDRTIPPLVRCPTGEWNWGARAIRAKATGIAHTPCEDQAR